MSTKETQEVPQLLPQSNAMVLPDEPEGDPKALDDLMNGPPAEQQAVQQGAAAAESAPEDLPEPLRGKSLAQIARMYQEAQQVIGRQSAEVGEMRRLADALIKQRLAEAEKAKQAKVEKPTDNTDPDSEFFIKPRDAVSKAVAEHPEIKRLREQAALLIRREQEARAKAATAEFQAAYPDAAETLANPEFQKWIQSSKYRQALLQRAHLAYDLDAAHEIFGTWRQLSGAGRAEKPAQGAAKPSKAETAKRELSAAAVPSGNAGASSEGSGKKIYRRIDVMRLMETDPERYEALAPEIQLAYKEGRVR